MIKNEHDLLNSNSYYQRIDEEDEKSNSPNKKTLSDLRKVSSNP